MVLELSNEGRTVKIRIGNIHLQYLGPKDLKRFIKITDVSEGCISVDTEFLNDGVTEVEEDYIDLVDVLSSYDYNVKKIINSISDYRIVEGGNDMKKVTREELVDKSLMVSDSIAMFPKEGTAGDIQMLCISLARPNSRALVRIKDTEVLESNMTEVMFDRVISAIKRNKKMITEQASEVIGSAKICRG